jgi:hypothetical protein
VPAPNPAPAEATDMPWPRISNEDNITAQIAQILNADNPALPPSQHPEGSVVTPPTTEHPADSNNIGIGSGNAGNGDSVNTKADTAVAPVAQNREEAADETEAEKDAEGEDEDVDGGGGDKKGEEMSPDAAMAVDPPQSFTEDGVKESDVKSENHEDETEQGDGDDNTVKAKIKPARGRPKKLTSGSRGKAKAKG